MGKPRELLMRGPTGKLRPLNDHDREIAKIMGKDFIAYEELPISPEEKAKGIVSSGRYWTADELGN